MVLSVSDCPPALRGDLSRWLLEIDTGVYVGKVSQRVREELWTRVVKHLKTGRAVMVFSARNEQKMDFKIHNARFEPIDFDGLKLMLRPSPQRRSVKQESTTASNPAGQGYSTAAKMRMAKRMQQARTQPAGFPETVVVIDLETSGLSPKADEIMELGAIKARHGQEVDCFQTLVQIKGEIPAAVTRLTGLTKQQLQQEGIPLSQALPAFLAFLGDVPIVAHNLSFDLEFLRLACAQTGLPFPGSRRMDTQALSEQYAREADNHRLETLMKHFQLPYPVMHRSLPDCRATLLLLNKLIEIRMNGR